MKQTNQAIAEQIYNAWQTKKPIAPIAGEMQNQTIESAYDIQFQWIEKRIQSGFPKIGRKIGLTSFKVQEQLGVNQPDFGTLLKDFQIQNNELSLSQLIQGKAEAEMAIVLKQDITKKDISDTELIEAIEYVSPCIEVVDSRIENWNISIYDTIADNASSAFFVLGENKVAPQKVDWKYAKMKMYSGDSVISEGDASQCLGNPLFTLRWLANQMIDLEMPLVIGEIVLCGALGPMHSLKQSETLKAEIGRVGRVELKLTNND